MTSASQLTSVLKNVGGFRGVFSSDTLPDTFRPGESLVTNYDPSDKPGSHWVAMRHAKDGAGVYFDSFGLPPDAEDNILHDQTRFRDWLSQHTRQPLRWNRVDLQSLADNVCGEWSCAFVLAGGLPEDRETRNWWQPLMRGNAHARDELVRRFIGIRPPASS